MKTITRTSVKRKRINNFVFLSNILVFIVCICLPFFTGCFSNVSKTPGEIYTSVSPSVFFIEIELENGGKAG